MIFADERVIIGKEGGRKRRGRRPHCSKPARGGHVEL